MSNIVIIQFPQDNGGNSTIAAIVCLKRKNEDGVVLNQTNIQLVENTDTNSSDLVLTDVINGLYDIIFVDTVHTNLNIIGYTQDRASDIETTDQVIDVYKVIIVEATDTDVIKHNFGHSNYIVALRSDGHDMSGVDIQVSNTQVIITGAVSQEYTSYTVYIFHRA